MEGKQQQNKGWHRAIYHHPDQWRGSTVTNMRHDIYSLGVCLVEIAMWESLFIRKVGADGSYS